MGIKINPGSLERIHKKPGRVPQALRFNAFRTELSAVVQP
jgi:hypothetical protein